MRYLSLHGWEMRDGKMDRGTDRWTEKTDRWTDERIYGWTSRQTDGQTDIWTDERIDG